MTQRQVTIVTTTYNCISDIEGYYKAFMALDGTLFDWIIIDAGSTDGTSQYLAERAERFSYYLSEADAGFYFGLNKAVEQVKTPYYMVFGADDRPAPDLLDAVLPKLAKAPALVLGAVRLMPTGVVKVPGPRWWHPWVWGRAISHHSVGTVIQRSSHQLYGLYDTKYSLVADGLFLKRILRSNAYIERTDSIFGDFLLGGMSSKYALRSIAETFLLQMEEGGNGLIQLGLFCLRVAKHLLLGMVKK